MLRGRYKWEGEVDEEGEYGWCTFYMYVNMEH
jgi:hypothetical protein